MSKELNDRRKLRVGWDVAHDGGNMTDFARKLGVSLPYVCKWIRDHQELRRALLDGYRRNCLSAEESERRAVYGARVRMGQMRQAQAARNLGISAPSFSVWMREHADEVDDAIQELRLAGFQTRERAA